MTLKSSEAFRLAQSNPANIFATDPRPTLIIDVLELRDGRDVPLEFANTAFTQQYGVLLQCLIGGQILEPKFIAWLKSSQANGDYPLGDLTWSSFTLDNRWKILTISACRYTPQSRDIDLNSQTLSLSDDQASNTSNLSSLEPSNEPIFRMKLSTGSSLTVALPSGPVNLGSAPTALEELHRSVDELSVGFFGFAPDGTLIFANRSWYALSGHPVSPNSHAKKMFLDLCHPNDVQTVSAAWVELMEGRPITFEMRWRHMSTPSAHEIGAQWVLAACVPVYDDDGQIRSIWGCTTDINTQKLSEQIAPSKAEALERARALEERFTRFATVAPIVIFNFDATKKMTYCNDRWFELTATQKKPYQEIVLGEGFLDGDIDKIFALIPTAIESREINSVDMCTKKLWCAPDGRHAQQWVRASILAEFTTEGIYQGCTGTLTEISEFKYAETLQRIRLEDALEAKQKQERFIDMTSHEMRNPLSAMVQCADSALAALDEIRSLIEASIPGQDGQFELDPVTGDRLLEEADLGLEGLHTIVSCCAHQKRIIDDVLTLSKLDSHLVSVTPVKVRPALVAQEVAKMFEMDAQKADVELTTRMDKTIVQNDIQWLMFDPSRVKQILINLISNAIKFTRTEATRKVELTMAATLQVPKSAFDGRIQFAPASRSVPRDLLANDEWGEGEIVYLSFSLQDTGRGLSDKEMQKLFNRFSQASPKTHVQYGGSGLGLFITRQLTELQGGEIGFTSEPERGSTFAFYVQTRRSTPPEPGQDTFSPEPSPPVPSVTPPIRFHGTPGLANKAQVKGTVKLSSGSIQISSSPTLANKCFPNVLVVEDNMINQKVLSTQLKRQGCQVFVAGHGVEALDFLKTSDLWTSTQSQNLIAPDITVDVILMDIEMPLMGGLECTRAIRELERNGSIQRPRASQQAHYRLPIIAISANARAEQGEEQRGAGVDDIVTKPFRIPQLMDKIRELVGLSVETPLGATTPVGTQIEHAGGTI